MYYLGSWSELLGGGCTILGIPYVAQLQSGVSSLAKHEGAYFSAVYGSVKDQIGRCSSFYFVYTYSCTVCTVGQVKREPK